LDVLAVFLRYPEPGRVKSRLAAAVGTEQAALAYRAMAETVLARLAGRGLFETWVFYDPPERGAGIRRWLDPYAVDSLFPQCGSDLGERMYNAFAAAEAGGARRTVLIGTDCPYVTTRHVELAFEGLLEGDVVMGPALDGGYYLIAMASPRRELFDGIRWGGDTVLVETLERIRKLGLTHSLLEPLRDIDRYEDYLYYLRVSAGPEEQP